MVVTAVPLHRYRSFDQTNIIKRERYTSFRRSDSFGSIKVLQFSLLALVQQLDHKFASVFKFLESAVFLFCCELALGLNVEECLIEVPVLLVEVVVEVPFVEQSLSLFFEVLLCYL